MPQSLSLIYVHLVYSTRDRVPFLQNENMRLETHAYLGGLASQHDCPGVCVGGTADHVHLLVNLGRESTIAGLVRDLKRGSSLWIKQRFEGIDGLDDFGWQKGYGGFSVSYKNVGDTIRYIETQETHHQTRTFQDEYRAILTKLGIKWDERYVWE